MLNILKPCKATDSIMISMSIRSFACFFFISGCVRFVALYCILSRVSYLSGIASRGDRVVMVGGASEPWDVAPPLLER